QAQSRAASSAGKWGLNRVIGVRRMRALAQGEIHTKGRDGIDRVALKLQSIDQLGIDAMPGQADQVKLANNQRQQNQDSDLEPDSHRYPSQLPIQRTRPITSKSSPGFTSTGRAHFGSARLSLSISARSSCTWSRLAYTCPS